jgi:hypothetical protein
MGTLLLSESPPKSPSKKSFLLHYGKASSSCCVLKNSEMRYIFWKPCVSENVFTSFHLLHSLSTNSRQTTRFGILAWKFPPELLGTWPSVLVTRWQSDCRLSLGDCLWFHLWKPAGSCFCDFPNCLGSVFITILDF